MVAAGPSLEKQVRQLQCLTAATDVLMIAVEAAVPFLYDNAIVPNIVITAEEQANSALIFKQYKGWFPMTALCASTTAAPLGVHMCRELGAEVFWYNNAHPSLVAGPRFASGLLPANVPSITPLAGSITFHAVSLAFRLGASEVGLVGCDFGVEDGGKTHAGEYTVDGIPASSMNEAFDWHARELKANRAAQKKIVNCTPGGRLEVFPRADLNDWGNIHDRIKSRATSVA